MKGDVDLSSKHQNIPKHIAIIMDGNGRWAKKRLLPRTVGHKYGVEALRSVIKHCSKIGVSYLTIYAFSTENWNRPKDEVNVLMDLLVNYLKGELKELDENNVKIRCIGDITGLPDAPRKELENSIQATESNNGLTLNIALNYGGRMELLGGFKSIAKRIQNGEISPEDITEQMISDSLYTAGQEDPDLIIRTSGEIRVSNFLLWQLAYSEFYFTDVFWPDFNERELDLAIEAYNNRQRRFGKL